MDDAGLAEVRAVRAAAAATTLTCVRRLPEASSTPIVLSAVRNELDVVDDLLRHHRAGGIERFAIVDNGSTDGTRQLLADQPDVELYLSDEGYSSATVHGWFHRLISDLGRDRWYLHVDADEQVVFDGWDDLGFAGLARAAEAADVWRVRGALVDRYAEAPVLDPPAVGPGGLSAAFPLFDAGPYAEVAATVGISRRGGPRVRGFADTPLDPELTKLPLFRLRPGETFANAHAIHPYAGNDGPCVLGINHYKFTAGFAAKIARARAERTYWNGSAEYDWYAQALDADPGLHLVGPSTRTYRSAADLVDHHVIDPVPWT